TLSQLAPFTFSCFSLFPFSLLFHPSFLSLFFFNDTPTTEIYTLFPTRRSSDLFVAALVTVVGAGVLLIAGANYFLDPLHFSASGQRQVAAVLLSGKNYAVFDANMDFRGLRREAIGQMTRTPNVIVFGGSRFELATPDLFPGRS